MTTLWTPPVAALCAVALLFASCSGDTGLAADAVPSVSPDSSDSPTESAPVAPTDPPEPTSSEDLQPLPSAVVCGTQYRPDALSMAAAEEPSLTVDRVDGSPVALGKSIEFDTMTLTVSYLGEAPEGRNVHIEVSTVDGESLTDVLYQLGQPALDEIQFAGDHGFTGLHYVNHEGASLQFACRAA